MRSMNKYGVILIWGTIGSVFAGGNCSGKVDKGSKSSKDGGKMELKFFCKAFGIIKEDIVYDCRYVDDKYIIPKEKKEAKFMN